MKMYTVGGCVRDELLGVPSNDIDFTVVLEDFGNLGPEHIRFNHIDPFKYMVATLENMGFKIFLETPEFLTVRARFPGKGYTVKDDMFNRPYDKFKGQTADFVLARKESDYTDGRRPDKVIPGTLEDDLARRDFTMNALAKAADGSLIDPFNGRYDINRRIIKAVGDPFERLTEDALRAVRAMRFAVTKQFDIDSNLQLAMESAAVLNAVADKISDERIQVELSKMFRFNTVDSLLILNRFKALTAAMFAGNVSLDATMKLKGRGH